MRLARISEREREELRAGLEGEPGKPASFLVLDAPSAFEAVRQRADVLASIRNGAYLFKKPDPSYEVELDLFRSTR